MDCAVGHNNVAFIVALARKGPPMPPAGIRTNGFELADVSRLEAESLRLRALDRVEANEALRPAFAWRSVL